MWAAGESGESGESERAREQQARGERTTEQDERQRHTRTRTRGTHARHRAKMQGRRRWRQGSPPDRKPGGAGARTGDKVRRRNGDRGGDPTGTQLGTEPGAPTSMLPAKQPRGTGPLPAWFPSGMHAAAARTTARSAIYGVRDDTGQATSIALWTAAGGWTLGKRVGADCNLLFSSSSRRGRESIIDGVHPLCKTGRMPRCRHDSAGPSWRHIMAPLPRGKTDKTNAEHDSLQSCQVLLVAIPSVQCILHNGETGTRRRY